MDSLSQQLSDLINPSPVLIDPEDDIHIETSAKVLISEKSDENQDIQEISLLRRQKSQNLSDINQRYSGIKVNRTSLIDSNDSDSSYAESDQQIQQNSSDEQEINEEYNEEEEEDNEEVEVEEEEEGIEFYSDNMRAPIASSEELDSGSGSDSNEDNIEEDLEEEPINDSNDEYINQFYNIDVSNQISKGKSLKNQLIIWDNLLEFRIKVQKLLIDCNRCPQFDYLSLLIESEDKQLKSSMKESLKSVKRLLDILCEIDLTLNSQNQLIFSENQSLKSSQELSKSDSVMSDDKQNNDLTERKSGLKRKPSDCSNYSEFLPKRHSNLNSIRNNIIDKWYEKTRFTSSAFRQKSFSDLEQSSTQQINRILSDMERLITRTQTKRSLYNIIGKNDINNKSIEINSLNDEKKSSEIVSNKDSDPEIFDDDDFYHQLLRELIESKTGNDTNDSSLLSGKWIQIQKLRNKIRRKVDTKASKGRKIRYDVHSKLVNFMAPVDNTTYTDDAKTQLFSSLFGQKLE